VPRASAGYGYARSLCTLRVIACGKRGGLAIVTTIFFKQGLWGYAQQRWGWALFPTSRRLRLP